MSLYKLQCVTYNTFIADTKEIIEYLVQHFPCLVAKKDTNTGTFPLYFTICNMFSYLVTLYSTKVLECRVFKKYVQNIFTFTYIHSVDSLTTYFANLCDAKERLYWLVFYLVRSQSLCDCAIAGM